MQQSANVKKKKTLINYEENRFLIQGNMYLSVNEMQVSNKYLNVPYNENMSV